jgi:type IV fimbrial biogenesis protein FimT
MRRRSPRGLTLIELMLALAIVAVLATLAMPSFGSMLARHRLKAAAENLALDLAALRQQSAQRQQPMHLYLQAGTQWCYALAVQAGCDCRVPQGCQLKTVRADDHPGVLLLEGGSLLVDAQPGAGSASVLLQGPDGSRVRVGLSRLGRPKVCSSGSVVAGYPGC